MRSCGYLVMPLIVLEVDGIIKATDKGGQISLEDFIQKLLKPTK